jgi:anthranilate synthase component 1
LFSVVSKAVPSFEQVCLNASSSEEAGRLLQLHQTFPERYPFLLESVAHTPQNRFSLLFAFPQERYTLNPDKNPSQFLAELQSKLAEEALAEAEPSDLPFRGGWFFYHAYDYAQVVEPSLNLPQSNLPLAQWVRIPAAVVFDHQQNLVCFVAEKGDESLLSQLQEDWFSMGSEEGSQNSAQKRIGIESLREEDEAGFLQGVERIREYILAGDVFQVNLSREWQAALAEGVESIDVYSALRRHNPAPFAALADFGDWSVISSSPERLVRYEAASNWVETRPIAGTRKRGQSLEKDLALMAELKAHPKEQAEHVMLIDLERNDLGRICQPGSVEVNELMTIETYQYVHHIVSNIRGQLQAGMSPLDVLHAVFPGGTITGCPKVRCMEIIAELEQAPRTAYTGSLGYVNRDGSLDSNILIRSFVHLKPTDTQADNLLQFRAGAGIVADSIPQRELEETRHKARGLLQALDAVEEVK